MQVQRLVRPYRDQRKWAELATVRFETGPGEQAQVDYGQLWVWIGEQPEKVHLFVFTLGYSRRLFTRALIATNGWRACSTATSARFAGLAE